MSRILVTGASGFLGAAVAELLRAEHVPVRTTGRRGEHDADADYWPADLRHSMKLPEMLTGVSGVVHCAGLAHQHIPRGQVESRYYEINCEATERLARAAAAAGVRRFVFVSSVSVYGPASDANPRSENAQPNPVGPYAKSKRRAEVRLLKVAAQTGLQVVILRMGTLYGEGDPGNLGRLAEAIKRRRFLMIGPGVNQKSLLHRDDAAAACVRAVLAPLDRPAGIWNVAGSQFAMKDIVDRLATALDCRPPDRHIPAVIAGGLLWSGTALGVGPIRDWARSRRATLKKWLAEDSYDASRFEREFDWRPAVSLDEGLDRLVNGKAQEGKKLAPLSRAA